jgi:dTMP kinase
MMTRLGPSYVAFEGGEGSGKSTQAKILAKRIGATLTREPGGTELGQELRRLLLNPGEAPVGARAETLMMAADRAQHAIEVVTPVLARGGSVVSDRTAFSSLAYQGGGRQLGVAEIRAVNDWALAGLWPDLVIFLECDPEVSQARLGGSLDRLEQEGLQFHQRVHQTYLDLAAANPETWVTVSAIGSIIDVAERIWLAVSERFDQEPDLPQPARQQSRQTQDE